MLTLTRKLYSFYAWGRRTWLSLWYRGNTYHCPLCGGTFRNLIPGGSKEPVWKEKNITGGGWRENLYCPKCYSSDKERLEYLVLQDKGLFTKEGTPIRVLHIAPERRIGAMLERNARIAYISGDLTPGRAKEVVDVTHMQFPDNSFDVVICSHVLEHIPEDTKAMREIARVLKPSGFAFLPVPISLSMQSTFENSAVTDPKDREKVFGQDDHVRIYGIDYISRLSDSGLRVDQKSAKEYMAERAANASIQDREQIFIATKA